MPSTSKDNDVKDALAGRHHQQQQLMETIDYQKGIVTTASDGSQLEQGPPLPAPKVLKHFSTLSLIGVSLSILNTWNSATEAIYTSLPAGGNTVMLFGTFVGGAGALLIAMSLGEVCHVLPFSGGQYHWTYILAPRRVRRPLSHLVGWLGTAGWVTLTASAPYFASTLTLNIIPAFHPTFEQQPYHLFLMYLAFTVYGTLINIFGVRIFDAMNRLSMWSSDASAITIFVTLLACAGSQHRLQPASFVFGWHINQTGWPDGVAWILGLLQTQYALAGVDGAAHLINEIEDAHINCPKAMVYSCVLGALHAFVVLVAVAATMTDPLAVIDAGPAAILTAFIQGVGNAAGGTALCVLALSTFLFNTPALMTACSRMVQSLAVDGQLPMANYLGRTHPKLEVPVWSIVFTTAWMAALGLLIFGSDDALSAILSSSVILLQTSYIPTIALVLMQRPVLHSLSLYGKTRYNLGPWAGRIINAGALAYIAVISTFLCFPTSLPVTDAASFNYTIAVVAGVLVLTAINWYAYARTNGRVPEEVRAKLGDDFE